jgi:Secretion system C-terminal sorting domain
MKKFLASVFYLLGFYFLQAQLTTGSVNAGANGTIHFYQFKPPHFNNALTYPLIISLHGGGEAGDGSPGQLTRLLTQGIPLLLNSGATMEFNWQGQQHGFVVLAPQSNADWQEFYVDAMITYGINNLRVDPNRIFITGYSLGGGGCWRYPSSSSTAASKIAGIVPVAGSPEGSNFCNIAQYKVATWAFHAVDDDIYPPSYTTDRVAAINSCNPLLVPAVDTVYPDGNHGIWGPRVYDTTNNTHYPNVYQWMIDVNRSTIPANNHPPVPISGGPAVTMIAPVKNFTLDGSASYDPDANDLIMDYLWEKISGPTAVFERTQWPTTKITNSPGVVGMDLGIYKYRLRVKDYLSQTRFDTISIEVKLPLSGHAAPATDAGPDVNIGSSITQVSVIGQARELSPGGHLSSYNWRALTGPNNILGSVGAYGGSNTYDGGNAVRFYNMAGSGTYTYEFSATNNFGDIGRDTIAIIKQTALPVNFGYFKGKNLGNSNILSWQTTAEINSDHFEILRSTNGIDFITVGTIASRGGSVATTYSYEDINAPKGLSYYKLSQVDKDGKATVSKIISINNTNRRFVIERYPNPVKDILSVTVDGNIYGSLRIVIADMQGKIVRQEQWNKNQGLIKKDIPVAALQNGIYQLVVLFTDGRKEVTSFVKY